VGYSHDEWTPLIIHEKMAGIRDAQFHAQIKSKYNCKQNSPSIVDSWTVPVVSDQPWNVLVGGGGVKTLLFCLGTAYNVTSMEDSEDSWLLC
jgi:hypothetical protein